MTDTSWIDGLKVAELKEELKKRDLPQAGVKAVLAERLREAVLQVRWLQLRCRGEGGRVHTLQLLPQPTPQDS